MIKSKKYPFSIFLTFLVITLLVFSLFVVYEVKMFEQSAGIPASKVIRDVAEGWQEGPIKTSQKDTIIFLILGTNQIPNRNTPPITDTMITISINTKTGRIGLFSIPRDLWSNDYKTKIDALYTYGFDRFLAKPEQFPNQVLHDMTDVTFDRIVVISPQVFTSIIDTVGGIDINVTHPFIDQLYPRSDVDVTRETDPAKLYETIEFKAGWQHMDGDRALKYVRSRHAEGSEGTDIARSARQRELISALSQKLKNPFFYTDWKRLGNLYKLYTLYLAKYLSIPNAVSILRQVYPLHKKFSLSEGTFSIYPDNPRGTIFHPENSPLGDGQWVFLVKDKIEFQKEIKSVLGLSN